VRRCSTAKLEGDKVLKRKIRIYGIDKDCIVTISQHGVKVQVEKTKVSVEQSWPIIIEKAMNTPGNVPSYLAGKPYHFLQFQATKRRKKVNESAV
jgi:hypothetical protein